MTLLGWPFDNKEPFRHGAVRDIPWAIAPGGIKARPIVCGYAQIPTDGHPWSNIESYDDIDVEVHGGLTFGPTRAFKWDPDNFPDELADDARDVPEIPATSFADTAGWVGFDTGHAYDWWTDEALAEVGLVREVVEGFDYHLLRPSPYDVFWTVDKVEEEAKRLALQIAEAKWL